MSTVRILRDYADMAERRIRDDAPLFNNVEVDAEDQP